VIKFETWKIMAQRRRNVISQGRGWGGEREVLGDMSVGHMEVLSLFPRLPLFP
jgi:hypothetical protein